MDKWAMPKAYANLHQWYSSTLQSLGTNLKPLGFIAAYPNEAPKLDTTHTFKFLSLNPSSGLWPTSGFSKDVIIGVIDTRIWPECESFKDDGMTEIPARWKGAC